MKKIRKSPSKISVVAAAVSILVAGQVHAQTGTVAGSTARGAASGGSSAGSVSRTGVETINPATGIVAPNAGSITPGTNADPSSITPGISAGGETLPAPGTTFSANPNSARGTTPSVGATNGQLGSDANRRVSGGPVQVSPSGAIQSPNGGAASSLNQADPAAPPAVR